LAPELEHGGVVLSLRQLEESVALHRLPRWRGSHVGGWPRDDDVGHGWAFYAALTLWICGDGFFTNISAIVATLCPIDLFRHRIWLVRNAHGRT
jgi:hypothetical protein